MNSQRKNNQSPYEVWHAEQTTDGVAYTGNFIVWNDKTREWIRFAGRIIVRNATPAAVYMREPPPEIWNHPHGRCWQLVEPGSVWFKLHWTKPAYDFNLAQYYVESLLFEAYQISTDPKICSICGNHQLIGFDVHFCTQCGAPI